MQRLKNILNAISHPHQNPSKHSLQVRMGTDSETHEINLYKSSDSYYINSDDLARVGRKGKPLLRYDPSLAHTIAAVSSICYIDGEKSLLGYRGYPIEQLARNSTFLQVSFLLIYGELPHLGQLTSFTENIKLHSLLPVDLTSLMKTFRYDAHPMGILVSTLAALSADRIILNSVGDCGTQQSRNKALFLLLGMMPAIAANSYRLRIGRSFNLPKEGLGYIQNFLYMIDCLNEKDYCSHPQLVRALEVLFIIHAEHELNCSTALLRDLTNAGSNVFSAVAAAAGALYGTRHGGANASVIRMLQEIGSIGNINKFLLEVKQKKRILYGFGHRVYKSKDPRAAIAKSIANEVFSICGRQPLIQIALQIEKITADDEYFVTRRLYPNVDFYNGLIYRAMGFPTDTYPVLFALPLLAGWLAHWIQALNNPTQIAPKQFYTGRGTRGFVELSQRKQSNIDITCTTTANNRRRQAQSKVNDK